MEPSLSYVTGMPDFTVILIFCNVSLLHDCIHLLADDIRVHLPVPCQLTNRWHTWMTLDPVY